MMKKPRLVIGIIVMLSGIALAGYDVMAPSSWPNSTACYVFAFYLGSTCPPYIATIGFVLLISGPVLIISSADRQKEPAPRPFDEI
jgi:hypothetical protein